MDRDLMHIDIISESQMAYFYSKYLIFWVPKGPKCVHTQKHVKMLYGQQTWYWWRSRSGVVAIVCLLTLVSARQLTYINKH